MAVVYISIGSNVERHSKIKQGIAMLKEYYPSLNTSPTYETAAIGFNGDAFYNLVASFNTSQTIPELLKILKTIELNCGRHNPQLKDHAIARMLDLDLLLYDNVINKQYNIPRDDITQYAFVLKPLCDIAPTIIHPILKQNINTLWQQFDARQQPIKQIELNSH